MEILEGIKINPGSLPEEWNITNLGSVINYRKGKKPNILIEEIPHGSLPYLTAEYFRTRKAKQFVPPKELSNNVVCETSDIVLIWDGSNAGDVFTGLQGVLASTMVKIVPDQCKLDRALAYFFLKTQFNLLNGQTTGSTIPHVNKAVFENLSIPLPPLPEQKAIAHILSTVQRAKEATEQVIQATKELKKSLMRYLFTYGAVPVEEAENVRLKETEIGMVPEEWQMLKLENVVEIVQGQVDPRVEPYSNMLNIGPENIESGTGRIIAPKTAAESQLRSGKYLFSIKNVLYSKIRPYLRKVALPTFSGVCSADMYPLNPKDGVITREFLFYFLLTDKFTDKAISFQSRTGIPKINRIQLKSIHIFLPPLSDQNLITHVLRAVDLKIETDVNRKKALDELFKSLLNNLMTGKIRVNNIEVKKS